MLHFGGTLTLNGVVSYMTVQFRQVRRSGVCGVRTRSAITAWHRSSSPRRRIPLNTALGGVTFSALSRLQNDAVRFRNYFLKGYSLNVSMTLPITIFSAVFAKDIFLVALGPKWADGSIIFQLLAPAVLFFGIINPLVWVLFCQPTTRAKPEDRPGDCRPGPRGLPCWIALWPEGRCGRIFGGDGDLALPHVIWCLRGTPISPLDLFRTAQSAAVCQPSLPSRWLTPLCAYLGPLQSPISQTSLSLAASWWPPIPA